MEVREKIEMKLRTAFKPEVLEIIDESEKHIGHHSSPPGGGSHFQVLIVAKSFQGLSRLERQRSIHAVLEEEFKKSLHALALRALTPGEYKS